MPPAASDLSLTTAGGPDMFLHINELKIAGIDPEGLKIGDRLTFEPPALATARRKPTMCGGSDADPVELGLKVKK